MGKLTFDTPPNSAVLQRDKLCIPVTVSHMRTQEMSGRGIPGAVLLRANDRAVPIVMENPRRKLLNINVKAFDVFNNTFACLAVTEAEANDFRGMLMRDGLGMPRMEFEYAGQLWGRAVTISDTAGIVTSIAVATTDVFVSFLETDWSR